MDDELREAAERFRTDNYPHRRQVTLANWSDQKYDDLLKLAAAYLQLLNDDEIPLDEEWLDINLDKYQNDQSKWDLAFGMYIRKLNVSFAVYLVGCSNCGDDFLIYVNTRGDVRNLAMGLKTGLKGDDEQNH